MPCYHPLKGYRSRIPTALGKRSITFNPQEAYHDLKVEIACGQCIGCRLERSRQWAIRCVHEASLYDDNCFITLTYSPENIPPGGSLQMEDFQKFLKRLRFKYSPRLIRFFHCGEYGEDLGRPHYHALLFNWDFRDKRYWKTVNGEKYFRSAELEKLWQKGFSIIGNVTFESAAYVARYITKKITGPLAKDHYGDKKPEYTTMSRRPGIGKNWYEKFKSDIFPADTVVIRGKKMGVPKFYSGLLEVESSLERAVLKAKRQVAGKQHEDNNTWERLKTRKKVKEAQINFLKRGIEK